MRMISELSESMVRAVSAGDVAAARIAHEAIGRLLDAAASDADGDRRAPVVDLAERRRRDS